MTETDTPQAPLPGDLGALFHLASRLMARAHHRRDHAHHAQARVLSIVRARGPMPQNELLELLDVRSSSLSELLAKLERQGLIVRERNEQDRRGYVVSAMSQDDPDDIPGDAPDDATDIHGHDIQGAPGDFFACLDDQERAQLRGLLRKLVVALRQDGEPAGPCGMGKHGRGMGLGRGLHGPGSGRGGKGMGGGRGGGRGSGKGQGQGGGRGGGRG